MNDNGLSSLHEFTSLIPGHAPQEHEIQGVIGPYKILKSVGKGGMGEVFLAYDTKCGRRVALKKIRSDLKEHAILHNRFLKEARITSQLTHPVIMPIYAIEDQKEIAYYTMPFVQGETLKQILRKTREQEKKGEALHYIGGSIPALIRIFIAVCQAVAYAHSKGVLHRDLKPENIMLGQYGEILIFDWGLAKLIWKEEKEEELPDLKSPKRFHGLTRPGKVVGTLNFMAPERALGNPASIRTEIYSLGVVLYQILTLRNPFRRKSLEEFRQIVHTEAPEDPILISPYRDVPPILSRIALRCLSKDPLERYSSVDELLRDLESYIEGRSEWFQIARLNIDQPDDWEFQENVLMVDHMAITRGTDTTDWVSLMISKSSFAENSKITARVTIGEEGYGVGFLLSLPEAAERKHLNDGYCLWLGSDINKSTKLLRSTAEVIHAPEVFLQRGETYHIEIKKIEHNIHFYLNGALQFSYISHLPLVGTHIGILARDADFVIDDLCVYVGSQNITVNCLAVPDAFLSHKDYRSALNEYRRIGYSFPGRAEGREAMFRAGIALLEEAKSSKNFEQREKLFGEALVEFEKLHPTPGAPLEYLGKAHVYQEMGDQEEEIKCYELGFRKYPKHPLLSILHEKLIYRIHEISRFDRKLTYLFMQTALSHLPEAISATYAKTLFERLEKHWEPLFFIDPRTQQSSNEKIKRQRLRIQVAFWLANSAALAEIVRELQAETEPDLLLLANALFSLVVLGCWPEVQVLLEGMPSHLRSHHELELIALCISFHTSSPRLTIEKFFKIVREFWSYSELRVLFYFMEELLHLDQAWLTLEIRKQLADYTLPKETAHKVHCFEIWALLKESRWEEAHAILQQYPLTILTKDSSLLFTLYGCWLGATENKEIALIHFSGILDILYPRSYNLLAHFMNGKISLEGRWGEQAFLWEKRQLFRQLALFYHCIGDVQQAQMYSEMEKKAR